MKTAGLYSETRRDDGPMIDGTKTYKTSAPGGRPSNSLGLARRYPRCKEKREGPGKPTRLGKGHGTLGGGKIEGG